MTEKNAGLLCSRGDYRISVLRSVHGNTAARHGRPSWLRAGGVPCWGQSVGVQSCSAPPTPAFPGGKEGDATRMTG